ncbi:MAG: hypothetical protein FD143_3791, partial [Ignavibacteria bacterium]
LLFSTIFSKAEPPLLSIRLDQSVQTRLSLFPWKILISDQ